MKNSLEIKTLSGLTFKFEGSNSTLDFQRSTQVKKVLPFESPYYTILSNFNWHYFSDVRHHSLLFTFSLYLLPFSRYSTSKFSGFDLDLWTLTVIWGRNFVYHWKAHIRLPIWLLWTTTSLYLVPLFRYSTSKFVGFDLDFWPLRIIWGQQIFYYWKGQIWLPIWLLWTLTLYLVLFSRYLTSKF